MYENEKNVKYGEPGRVYCIQTGGAMPLPVLDDADYSAYDTGVKAFNN